MSTELVKPLDGFLFLLLLPFTDARCEDLSVLHSLAWAGPIVSAPELFQPSNPGSFKLEMQKPELSFH